MNSTDPFLATVGQADHRIYGTQQTRSFNLLVHADRLPSGQLDYDGSVAFAHRAADHKYTLVMYGDGSGNYLDPRSPRWTGVAAAWKRKDEPLYHVVGRTIKRRMETDEMELQAVNECMDTALLERWDVEQQVIVMTDNIYALQAIKDWLPGQGGRNESALQRLKRYDDLFAEQGVPVAVRYLKGRRYVEGHDTADVWARQLATTMHHIRFSPVPEYQDQERLIYKKIWLWMLAVNESRENNSKWIAGHNSSRNMDNCTYRRDEAMDQERQVDVKWGFFFTDSDMDYDGLSDINSSYDDPQWLQLAAAAMTATMATAAASYSLRRERLTLAMTSARIQHAAEDLWNRRSRRMARSDTFRA